MARRGFVFALDTTLFVALIVLLTPHLTGLPLHEWMGLAIGVPVLAHLLLSWRWIATTTRRMLRAPARTRINYLLNATLFVLFVVAVVSGLVVSRVAAPAMGILLPEDWKWRTLHNGSSNFLMPAIALHLAMNWTWVHATFAKLRSRTAGARIGRAWDQAIASIARRSGAVLGIAGAVGGITLLAVGVPSAARRFPFNELANYRYARPAMTRRHLAMETAFILGFAIVARLVLRIRLEAGRKAVGWRWGRERRSESDTAGRLRSADPAA